MADDGIKRRDLLRGRLREREPDAAARAWGAERPRGTTATDRPLPDVIAWLDPEMRASQGRGAGRGGTRDAAIPLLRPPGALAEPEFMEACTRCGDCITACPHDAIVLAPERLRAAAGTPIIDPLLTPCAMCEDLPCIAACEPGALREEAPAALGLAHVSELDCLGRMGTPCTVCVERCPVPGALASIADVPVVNAPLCTGCGICQHVCPAPVNAIAILPNAERPTRAVLAARVSTPGSASTGDSAPAPAPAEQEDHEEIELPELQDEIVNDETVRQLFADLEALTEVLEVRVKGAPDRHASAAAFGLAEARALLAEGRVRAVQIVYRHGGSEWCDTVMRHPDGHRLLRMETPMRAESEC